MTVPSYDGTIVCMNAKHSTQKTDDGGKSKMVQRSVQVEEDLWNNARRRTIGATSISEVVRKLLRLWLDGKINLDDYED